MEFKNFPCSPTMVESQNKPLVNLLNAYPDFKKNESLRPFNSQSWSIGKNCILTSLMFLKWIYRSGKAFEFAPCFEIRVAGPDNMS